MTARETPAGEEWRGNVGKLSEEELDTFLAGGNVARLGYMDYACVDHIFSMRRPRWGKD